MNVFEAFRALEALNEDTFSISDDGIKKLSDFENQDDLQDDISVIDPEAETEEDIKDSYVGKVILDCCVCHSKLYKDKEEVQVDEEEALANIGEECPYCYTSDGFKVIGEVAPFDTEEVEEETETEETDETEDTEDIDTEDEKEDSDKVKEESLNEDLGTDLEKYQDWVDYDMKRYGKISEQTNKEIKEAGLKIVKDKYGDYEVISGSSATNEDWKSFVKSRKRKREDLEDKSMHVEDGKLEEDLNESINNLSLDTEDTHMEMTSDDNGKVTITTEPVENQELEGEEVIAPLSDETEAEIEANSEAEEEPIEDEETSEEEVDMEIDDFDEESFDETNESYLKSMYENVESYKTTKVSSDANKLFIEGLIKFSSGNTKKTSFILESKELTKEGKASFSIKNKELTENYNNNLIGNIKDNKFITEELK